MRTLALALSWLSLAACGEGPPAATETHEDPPAPALQDLAAIGYAEAEPTPRGAPRGVTKHDRERAWPGLNLTTDERSACLALDMDGNEVHRWTVPGHDQVEHFALLPGGRVVAVSVDQGVTLLERDSRVVWQRSLPAHHDVRATGRGTFLVPIHTEGQHRGRRVRFDSVVELDGDGREFWRWEARAHVDALAAMHGEHPLDAPTARRPAAVYDYHHLNAALELPGGDLLVCLRNVSLVARIDRATGRPTHGVGPGVLDFPHDPTPLAGGGVLVFDNGYHRGSSRLVELDRDGRITWSWEADPPESFYSQVRGACQLLPNRNLLVTESQRGRVFELTRGGEVVWEWRNPAADGAPLRVYRMRRVQEDALER